MIEADNPHGDLIASDTLAVLAVGLDEAQPLLTVVFLGNEPPALQGTAQHDRAALVLSAGEGQRTVDFFPAPTCIRPSRDPKQALDVTLDVLLQAQLEQPGLCPRFEFAQGCRPS